MMLDHEVARASRTVPTLDASAAGRGHEHAARFYVDDESAMDDVARFLAAALRGGQSAVALATPDHRDALARRLTAAGIDVPAAIAGHRYLAVDAAETLALCFTDGRIDQAAFERALDDILARCAPGTAAGSAIAAFGELVGLLSLEGRFDEAIRLESYWNALLANRRIALYCAYPARAFARAEETAAFKAICDLHQTILPDDTPAVTGDDDKRSRAITLLQHRARVARTEADRRARAEMELRQREAELTGLLEQAIDGIQRLDSDGIVRFANPAMLKLLGYPAAEYVGSSFARVQLDPERYADFWDAIVRRDDPIDRPLDLLRADGTVVSVLVRAACRWEGRRLAEIRCMVRDVTAQRALEQQLREQNERLAAALEARDEFLLVAAHELKTPITSLRIFTQLLQREQSRHGAVPPDRLGKTLESIDRQSALLTQLIGRLLDSASIDAGVLRIEPVEADLAALVRATVNEQALAGSHRFDLDAPASLLARIDPIRFTQVITNLLVNACRYSAPQTLVSVALARAEDGGVRLTVTDRGVGIPPDQREAVFARYHQAHASSHLSGLGLGLAIAKQIVMLHGGAIWVEDPPHPGSRFVVKLPPSAG